MYAQQQPQQQPQRAYAPTAYSYTPSSSLTATINLDEVGYNLHYPLPVLRSPPPSFATPFSP